MMKIDTRRVPKVTMRVIDVADPDSWICRCGNTPLEDGFYPCDTQGRKVEPTPEEWTTNCYVCDRCGRIIEQSTREVVGTRVVVS